MLTVPAIEASTTTGRARRLPSGVIVAADVAGDVVRRVRARHRESVDAQQGAQLGPRDLTAARDQDEAVLALSHPDHHRLQQLVRLDAARRGGLGEELTGPWRVTT